jgi:hypothetical protein
MRFRRNRATRERLIAQETLILEATERIVGLAQDERFGRDALADMCGWSRRKLDALLRGDRELTVRDLSDMAYVLGYTFSLVPEHRRPA